GQTPVSIALKHLQTDPPSIRQFDEDIPQSVENIVLRAMAKDPFHRYQTVSDMEAVLERSLQPEHINEKKYILPIEECEETNVIPILNDDACSKNDTDIIHEFKKIKKISAPNK